MTDPQRAGAGLSEILEKLKRLPVIARACESGPHESHVCNSLPCVNQTAVRLLANEAIYELDRLRSALRAPQQHGRDCPKVEHHGAGYLHEANSDGPYDVDGVLYCGRCHGWLESKVSSRAPQEGKA